MKKRHHSKFHNTYLLIVLAIVIVILLYVLLIQTETIENPFLDIIEEDFEVNATDRCSLIAGQLIHTINTEGECRNVCFSECEVRKSRLKEFEFREQINNCNICTCYCG